MGVPEDKISHLVNPNKSEFFAAIEKVKQLASNGKKPNFSFITQDTEYGTVVTLLLLAFTIL